MQTSASRSRKASACPARPGLGTIGASEELRPFGGIPPKVSAPDPASLRRVAFRCFAIGLALLLVLALTGCASSNSSASRSLIAGIAAGIGSMLSNATGSLSYSHGPVQVGIASDGRSVSRFYRVSEGKNAIELRRDWRRAQ